MQKGGSREHLWAASTAPRCESPLWRLCFGRLAPPAAPREPRRSIPRRAGSLKHHHESVLLPMRRAKPNGSFESRLCESEHTTQGHLTLSFQWDTMCWKLARSKKRPEVPPGLNASLWCSGSLLSQLEVAATAHFSLGLCPQVAGRRSCTASHAVF